MATNPSSATSTIVAPGGTSTYAEVPTPISAATIPTTIAPAIVDRKPRANCCDVATGTTISALTSSRPTVRIATATVTAASTEIRTL